MSHNVVIACLLVGICSFYWLTVAVILTKHRAAQRILRLVMPWLVAVIVLGLYIPGFLQYGLSPFPVVMCCFFVLLFVLLGLFEIFIRSPLSAKLSWSVLLLGVLNTVWTALTVMDIYAWEVLKRHQTGLLTGDRVLGSLAFLLMLFSESPLKRTSQRLKGNL